MSNRLYKDHPEKLSFYTVEKLRLISAAPFQTMHEQSLKAELYECQTQCGPILALWTGKQDPPKPGTRVNVTMNSFGRAEVIGYFVESGFLGVEVKLDVRPAWHIKANGDRHSNPLVFGDEIERS